MLPDWQQVNMTANMRLRSLQWPERQTAHGSVPYQIIAAPYHKGAAHGWSASWCSSWQQTILWPSLSPRRKPHHFQQELRSDPQMTGIGRTANFDLDIRAAWLVGRSPMADTMSWHYTTFTLNVMAASCRQRLGVFSHVLLRERVSSRQHRRKHR